MTDLINCPRCGASNELPFETGIFCKCQHTFIDDHTHGSKENPCSASCERCGWEGRLPSNTLELSFWMREAIVNGWRPPIKRELK